MEAGEVGQIFLMAPMAKKISITENNMISVAPSEGCQGSLYLSFD
jgi:hypothetical protein